MRNKQQLVASHICPDRVLNLQPKYVPCLGVKPPTFWSMGRCSNQLSHTGQGCLPIFQMRILKQRGEVTCPRSPSCGWGWPEFTAQGDFKPSGSFQLRTVQLSCLFLWAAFSHHQPSVIALAPIVTHLVLKLTHNLPLHFDVSVLPNANDVS